MTKKLVNKNQIAYSAIRKYGRIDSNGRLISNGGFITYVDDIYVAADDQLYAYGWPLEKKED